MDSTSYEAKNNNVQRTYEETRGKAVARMVKAKHTSSEEEEKLELHKSTKFWLNSMKKGVLTKRTSLRNRERKTSYKKSQKVDHRDLKVGTWKLSMLVKQHASILCSLTRNHEES